MKVVPLGELCHIKIGRTPSRENPDYWGGPHAWATISDLADGPLSATKEGVTDLAVKEARLQAVAPGTLLYSFKLTIGKMAVAGRPLYTNEAIAALIPLDPQALDSRYLRYALATINADSGASTAVKGRTLNSETLARLPVPLVPIEEQRRIAGLIANQFAAVETARSNASERAASAQSVRESVLRLAFETSTESWTFQSLSSLCEFVSDGTHQPPQFTPDGVAFLFISNIVSGRIDFADCRYVSHETWTELTRRRRPLPGDLLFSAVGSFGIAVVVDTDRPFTFQRHIAHLRLRPDVVIPQFVGAYLNSPRGRQQSESVAFGGAQRTVTLRSLGEFRIPVPTLSEQATVMATLNERLATIDAMTASSDAESNAIRALPAALIRRAFDDVAV